MKGYFKQLAPRLKEIRRDIHRHPETSFQEFRTQKLIAAKLQEFGLQTVHTGLATTGVVGTIRGTLQGQARTVGLRADIDALPMHEEGNPGHKSTVPGKFHGCGHDGHTTMLLGASKYLQEHRHEFSGDVHVIFQPAEEGDGGAKVMMEDGLFERFPCEQVFAMHNWPGLKQGVVDVQPGPRMASNDNFDITLEGNGGHAAFPHLCSDPIVAASAVIMAIQSLVSRNNNPVDPLVISVTQFQIEGSKAYNVIPAKVKVMGTMRCFSPQIRKDLPKKFNNLVQQVALGYDCRANIKWHDLGFPPTVNDVHASQVARLAALQTVGSDGMVSDTCPASMGAEDFSYMLEQKPGAYVFLGAGESSPALHHPTFDFNDALLPVGAELFVNMALQSLARD